MESRPENNKDAHYLKNGDDIWENDLNYFMQHINFLLTKNDKSQVIFRKLSFLFTL